MPSETVLCVAGYSAAQQQHREAVWSIFEVLVRSHSHIVLIGSATGPSCRLCSEVGPSHSLQHATCASATEE